MKRWLDQVNADVARRIMESDESIEIVDERGRAEVSLVVLYRMTRLPKRGGVQILRRVAQVSTTYGTEFEQSMVVNDRSGRLYGFSWQAEVRHHLVGCRSASK